MINHSLNESFHSLVSSLWSGAPTNNRKRKCNFYSIRHSFLVYSVFLVLIEFSLVGVKSDTFSSPKNMFNKWHSFHACSCTTPLVTTSLSAQQWFTACYFVESLLKDSSKKRWWVVVSLPGWAVLCNTFCLFDNATPDSNRFLYGVFNIKLLS